MEREILLLGNPKLYEISEEIKHEELEEMRPIFEDMFDSIRGIRRDYGFGRAIAAPQIGVQKRLICMLTDKPHVIINPTLEFVGDEMIELMDDCMSFPKLLVRVRRYRHCILRYRDENWEMQEKEMDDDMSELIQHEYDHLDGISMAFICRKIKLPRIIGMLVTGIVLGPFVLDLLDPQILGISSELRKMALVIILIKAGLSLDISDLKKIGRSAVLMSFLPALFEIGAFVLLAPFLLHVTVLEAAIMGAVLGAVSPAVVVPRMVQLMDENYGTDKQIPQLILAGASLDDVFVIVLFSTFVGMAQGDSAKITDFVNIPISIVSGILLGAVFGFVIAFLFELAHKKSNSIRQSIKVTVILGSAFLLMAIEGWLDGFLSISGLLAVMSMALVIKMRTRDEVAADLSEKYGKLWLAAEVILFVLVGAAVDIRYTLNAGFVAILMILIALVFRSVGVLLCLVGTKLNRKEKLYCVIAYLPKATVQAAIGSVPLSLGLPCGNMVLSVAVLSILITAPLGAIGMDLSYKKLLRLN